MNENVTTAQDLPGHEAAVRMNPESGREQRGHHHQEQRCPLPSEDPGGPYAGTQGRLLRCFLFIFTRSSYTMKGPE